MPEIIYVHESPDDVRRVFEETRSLPLKERLMFLAAWKADEEATKQQAAEAKARAEAEEQCHALREQVGLWLGFGGVGLADSVLTVEPAANAWYAVMERDAATYRIQADGINLIAVAKPGKYVTLAVEMEPCSRCGFARLTVEVRDIVSLAQQIVEPQSYHTCPERMYWLTNKEEEPTAAPLPMPPMVSYREDSPEVQLVNALKTIALTTRCHG